MNYPKIAIIGKPNVGKSTLFNYFVRKRRAITGYQPNLTRDVIVATVSVSGKQYEFIDTGGITTEKSDSFWPEVQRRAKLVIEQADFVIFVVDATTEPTAEDMDVADLLRTSGKKCVIFANKAEKSDTKLRLADYYSLNIGEVFKVSALHGLNIWAAFDYIVSVLYDSEESKSENIDEGFVDFNSEEHIIPKVAIVGRPNVGKSSIINHLTDSSVSIVSELAGTTRDIIEIQTKQYGFSWQLYDTPGIYRRGKAKTGVERFSVLRTYEAIKFADICVLVLDCIEFPTAQDKHIAEMILKNGSAMIIVLNKWDLAESQLTKEQVYEIIKKNFVFVPGLSIIPTSTLSGLNLHKVIPAIIKVWDSYAYKFEKQALRQQFFKLVAKLAPAPQKGLQPKLINIYQSGCYPPNLTIVGRHNANIHFSYMRYIENGIRSKFEINGAPLVFNFKEASK